MKIGILTFHRALNYGAVFQCYALYQTLNRLGHDVEVIDYRPESIEKYRMTFRKKTFSSKKGLVNKIKYLLSCLFLVNSKKRTRRKFDSFLDKHFKLSDIVDDVNSIYNDYDIIVFGSDQIWSPEVCEGMDKIYYGQFPKKHSLFITYAASVGRIELIKGKNEKTFKEYLKVFDLISVRELKLQNFILEKCHIPTEMVCDPTLLLEKEEYDNLSIIPAEKNYVLLFNLTKGSEALPFANRVAKQLKTDLIEIKAETNLLKKKSYIHSEVSPEEFLGYIKYAKCVITDSYHATVFSIILQKNFYTLLQNNNNDRSQTLLKSLGLLERLVSVSDFISFEQVDYTDLQSNMKSYKATSKGFIEKMHNRITQE